MWGAGSERRHRLGMVPIGPCSPPQLRRHDQVAATRAEPARTRAREKARVKRQRLPRARSGQILRARTPQHGRGRPGEPDSVESLHRADLGRGPGQSGDEPGRRQLTPSTTRRSSQSSRCRGSRVRVPSAPLQLPFSSTLEQVRGRFSVPGRRPSCLGWPPRGHKTRAVVRPGRSEGYDLGRRVAVGLDKPTQVCGVGLAAWIHSPGLATAEGHVVRRGLP